MVEWGKIVVSILSAVSFSGKKQSTGLLKLMSKDSEEAADLREVFSHYSSRLQIASFCEGLITSRPIGKVIVSKDSAFMDLPNERRITLHANHVDMCKYSSAEDTNLRIVGRVLADLVDSATAPEPDAAPPGNAERGAVSSSMFNNTNATEKLTTGR
jgi:hypothetical protein